MASNTPFTFEISLSVLNHLGRHLYRSFATVLGEAISNAWDADARNVWIYIDPNRKGFWIKDDGIGMTANDFQDKFLKIGYSKRRGGKKHSAKGRPFIGSKGIGKLALLSCAKRISVISRTKGSKYTGGAIDNSKLDVAIKDDLKPQEYSLAAVKQQAFAKYKKSHQQGTIIRFEAINDNVKHSFKFLAKIIALYFRFSLIDKSFKIYLNDKLITHKHLRDLAEKTEFLWTIGKCEDPYVKDLQNRFSKDKGRHEDKRVQMAKITGFVASVEQPRDRAIMTTAERVGVDLFVNGRLRERNILGHIPTASIVENYLYGQIHFNGLDDSTDRFTSSREGIVAGDPKYREFLEGFRDKLLKIVQDWDKLRIKHREEGDAENKQISKRKRASLGLYNAVAEGYKPPKTSARAGKVDKWVNDLSGDAAFNFDSYAECFISENLVRKYIVDKKIALTQTAKAEAKKWRDQEEKAKHLGNLSITIHRGNRDLSYLSMDTLAKLVDKSGDSTKASLVRDSADYRPIRNAIAHTALLTDEAKDKLKTIRDNIKGRVKRLLSRKKQCASAT